VITYLRDSLNPVNLILLQDKCKSLNLEVTATKCQPNDKRKPLIFLGVYRPPTSPLSWFDRFREIISDAMKLGSLVILGDLNCDLLQPALVTSRNMSNILAYAKTSVNQLLPTRITTHSATCLDIIAVDKNIEIIEYKTEDLAASDHYPVSAVINISWSETVVQPVMKRSFNKVNLDSLSLRISSISIENSDDPSTMVEDFNNRVISILDDIAPKKAYPWRKNKLPWMTKEIKSEITNRDALSRQFKKQPTDHLAECLRIATKRIRSVIRHEAKNEGRAALRENNHRNAWRFIKQATFTNRSQQKLQISPKLLNDFFGDCVSNKQHRPLDSHITAPTLTSDEAFTFQTISVHEVEHLLHSTSTRTSMGPDELPAFLLKSLSPAFAPSITEILNLSLSTGVFPSSWKLANVTPIWKNKGSKSDPNNYRPISILPILSRIFEKIVASQLYYYCEMRDILPIQQFGFRKESSCEYALLHAANTWIEQIEAGNIVGALLVDLSKAFDSVPHQDLLTEMRKIGCSSPVIDWFSSYLSDRFQRVIVRDVTTEWTPVTQGVPQGSGLSPLLFNIYVRDLPRVSPTDTIQFADDVTHSAADRDVNVVVNKLQQTYVITKEFCLEKKLKINAEKTQLILFKTPTRKVPNELTICIDGHNITPSSSVKLLGFLLDQHLTFSEHIDTVVSKCHALLGVLARAAPSLPRELLKLTYTALIRSHLEYASSIFMGAAKTHLTKLDRIQKAAARIIYNVPRDAHSAPLLLELGLDSLEDRRDQHMLRIINSIMSGHCHPALRNSLELDDVGDMVMPQSRLAVGNRRLKFVAAKVFNHQQNGIHS